MTHVSPRNDEDDAARAMHYAPVLRRFFRRRARRPSEVDDLVQETLLSLHARKTDVAIANPQGYLFTVASHVLSRYRQREARARQSVELLSLDATACEEISPERYTIGKDGLERALSVIEGLPEKTRDIFLLHRFDGMTYSAIARHHNVSVSAVEKHIMAALRSLLGESVPP